jgi:DNA sulfur modification protein DndB
MAEAPIVTIEGVVRRVLEDRNGRRRTYYFGTVMSDVIKEITFVPVLEKSVRTYLTERTEDGYQRYASTSRMADFARFLEMRPLSVAPPVLLSSRGQWAFEPYEGQKDLGRLLVYCPAAIVDGQHRVGGFVRLCELKHDVRPVDFILISELPLDEERREFFTINTTQKGVARPLTAYLGMAEDENVWIAWQLNEREDSPFYGRITRQRLQKQHLFALHSVAKNVKRTFDHGAFDQVSAEDKLEILIRYWRLIADKHPKEWEDIAAAGRADFKYKLLELAGFIAWSHVGPQILGSSFDPEAQSMDWAKVESLIERASWGVSWRRDGKFEGMAGEAGGEAIRREIERCISAWIR